MKSRRTGRASRAAAGLISFLVLAGLTGGLPAVLFAAGGQPVPRAVPSWHQLILAMSRPDDGTLALTAIRTVTWLAWAAFTLCAAREAASALRGNRARPILGLAPLQGLSAILISAILAATGGPEAAQAAPLHPPASAEPLRARPAGALQADARARRAEDLPDIALPLRAFQADGAHRMPPAPAPSSAPPQDRSSGELPLGSPRPGSAATRSPRPRQPRTYRVRPGDDLWDIAARYLGSPGRWPELYWLNAGRPQPGGGALCDPNLIYPGWVLLLTPPGTGSNGPHAPGPAHRPCRQHASWPAASPSPGPAAPRRDHQATRPHHDQASQARRTAVSLPGGGLVSYSVALMAAAALTLAALQRRRRYKPGTNPDPVIRPAAPPPPAVIRALRQAARSVPATAGPETGAGLRADPYPDPYGDDTDPAGAATPAPPPPGSAPAAGSLPVRRDDPDPPGPAQPAAGVQLGMRGTSEAVIDIAAVGGIGLTGPGAAGAARAALTALLARPRAQFPSVIIPAALASLLMPGDGPVPGVSAAATVSQALDEMETAVLRQARAAAEPSSQVAALEPGVVLFAASAPAITRRLAGTLAAGRGQQAAAILLGPWEPGVTCYADADGIITATTPATPSLDGVRLFTLSADEARAIADLLRDAGGPPRGPAGGRRLPEPGPVRSAAQLPAPVPSRPGAASGARPSGLQPATSSPAGPRAGSAGEDGDRPDRLVRITVLGPTRVTAAGKDISGGLRKARELLAYLATFPGGASGDAISEALWPGSSSPAATTSQRNLALRKARGLLRAATGMTAPAWIIRTAGRYRLDPAMISADLWDFSAALDQARQAPDPAARLTALRKAVALYQGDLAEGEGYDWAEPYAETARRRALDAWTAIAGILQPDNPAQALDALETALGHDPYNEHLYQQIMRLQARAGHPEAVRRTLSLLESRLTELGVAPGAQTRQFAAGLLGTAPQHRAESTTRPVARSPNA